MAPVPGTTPRLPIDTARVRQAVIGAITAGVTAVQVDAIDMGVLIVPALRTRLRVVLTWAGRLDSFSDAAARVAQATLGVNAGAGGTWLVSQRTDNPDAAVVALPQAVSGPSSGPATPTPMARASVGTVVASAVPPPGASPGGQGESDITRGIVGPVLVIGGAVIVVGALGVYLYKRFS